MTKHGSQIFRKEGSASLHAFIPESPVICKNLSIFRKRDLMSLSSGSRQERGQSKLAVTVCLYDKDSLDPRAV